MRFYAFTDSGEPEFYYEDAQGVLRKWPSSTVAGMADALPEGR